MSGKTHDVFVSYASADRNIAFAVCHGLESAGLRCWIAPRDINPGGDFPAEIVNGISGARAFVIVFSGASNGSPHVAREVHHAAESRMPLIPFRLEDVRPTERLGYYLSATHWMDALDPPLEVHIRTLATVIRNLIGMRSVTGSDPGAATPPPVPAPAAMPSAPVTEPIQFEPEQPEASGKKPSALLWIGLVLVAAIAGGAFLLGGGGGTDHDAARSTEDGTSEPTPPPAVRTLASHVDEPAEGAFLARRSVRVRGRVDGDSSGARVTVSGHTVPLDDGVFETMVAATDDGPLLIEVRCEGDGIVCPTVTRSVVVDTTAPVIEVTNPRTATHTSTAPLVRIEGRVVDANPGTLWADGRTVSVGTNGSFTWPVSLSVDEEATVAFEATDKAGNKAKRVTRTLRRQRAVAAWEASLDAAKAAGAAEDWTAAAGHLETAVARGAPAVSIPAWLERGIAASKRARAVPPWAKVSPEQLAEAKKRDVPVAYELDLGAGVNLRFVLIPSGTFWMGSPDGHQDADDDEKPRHRVTLSRPFYLSIHEVTNAAFKRFKPTHESGTDEDQNDGDRQPVVSVSHGDATKYARWLSNRDRAHRYRLPTEAEWERAARGGDDSSKRYYWGNGVSDAHLYANAIDPMTAIEFVWENTGWPNDDGHRNAAPVGSYRPNAYGLLDMIGNASEWCADWWGDAFYVTAASARDPSGPDTGSSRILRGGSWGSSAGLVRLAYRYALEGVPSDVTNPFCGFRVAASLPIDDDEVPFWAKVSQAQLDAASRHGVPVAFENDIGIRFVLIPSGTFWMGSPAEEESHEVDETRHRVTLTKPYYLSIHEVTNEQYRQFRSTHDSGMAGDYSLDGDRQPAVSVSHSDATAFATSLGRHDTTHTYRLPTEAEWERAARGGDDTPKRFYWGDRDYDGHLYGNAIDPTTKAEFEWEDDGWRRDDGHRVAAKVGSYRPNAYGLFDTCGNATEWCADRWSNDWYELAAAARDPSGPDEGTIRVRRGGCWGSPSAQLRLAFRYNLDSESDIYSGFRVAASLPLR